MKKLISIISAIGLTATASTAVVSCSNEKSESKSNDLKDAFPEMRFSVSDFKIETVKGPIKDAIAEEFNHDGTSTVISKESYDSYLINGDITISGTSNLQVDTKLFAVSGDFDPDDSTTPAGKTSIEVTLYEVAFTNAGNNKLHPYAKDPIKITVTLKNTEK